MGEEDKVSLKEKSTKHVVLNLVINNYINSVIDLPNHNYELSDMKLGSSFRNFALVKSYEY